MLLPRFRASLRTAISGACTDIHHPCGHFISSPFALCYTLYLLYRIAALVCLLLRQQLRCEIFSLSLVKRASLQELINSSHYLDTNVTAMLGVALDASGAPRFSLNNLRVHDGMPEGERKKRLAAVHALYGWESVERIEAEFSYSVAPYYDLIDHHAYLKPSEVLTKLLCGALPSINPNELHQFTANHLLSPIDVFSLAFRHITANETMEQLALHLGIRYHHLNRLL